MDGLLIWLIGFAVFVYLILPVLLRFNQKYKPNTDLEPVTLSALPPDAAQYLGAIQQALESEGFQTIGHFSWGNPAPNVFPLLTLFMDREKGIKAVSAVFYVVSAQGAKITTRYVEFITRYEDGIVLLTNNNGSFGTFQRVPTNRTLRLVEKQNPHELLAIHCQRMAQRAGLSIEALPEPGLEVSVHQQRSRESFEEQAKFGRLYFDQSTETYRPTWKGAYLMTWSQLWPMKAIKKPQAKREALAELQSLRSLRADTYQV